MSNQPKTPHRTIRVSDELWVAARAKAENEGRNLSELIREFLTRYAEADPSFTLPETERRNEIAS